MRLNIKQKTFCEEYIVDLNGTQAAIRAGYSPFTAGSQGERLLKNVEIQAEILRLMKERSERLEIKADEVVQLCFDLASSNIFTILAAIRAGTVDDLSKNVQRAVKSIKHKKFEKEGSESEEITITMHDKIQPLSLLWRHLGLGMNDTEAISALSQYGTVTRTDKGFEFEYADDGTEEAKG